MCEDIINEILQLRVFTHTLYLQAEVTAAILRLLYQLQWQLPHTLVRQQFMQRDHRVRTCVRMISAYTNGASIY